MKIFKEPRCAEEYNILCRPFTRAAAFYISSIAIPISLLLGYEIGKYSSSDNTQPESKLENISKNQILEAGLKQEQIASINYGQHKL